IFRNNDFDHPAHSTVIAVVLVRADIGRVVYSIQGAPLVVEDAVSCTVRVPRQGSWPWPELTPAEAADLLCGEAVKMLMEHNPLFSRSAQHRPFGWWAQTSRRVLWREV